MLQTNFNVRGTGVRTSFQPLLRKLYTICGSGHLIPWDHSVLTKSNWNMSLGAPLSVDNRTPYLDYIDLMSDDAR